MSLLNKTSLYKTVDNVNEALFYGKKISKTDAKETMLWIASRLDTPFSYNKSFGVTRHDITHPVYTFTGERLTSSASMRHIMAEESCRALLKLSEITGYTIPELEKNEIEFGKMLQNAWAAGKPVGTYCCSTCTVGLWRNFAAGGLPEFAEHLPEGLMVLHYNHDGSGKWGRFPFFYTLLTLSEIDDPAALKEINYAQTECERALERLRKDNKFSKRKRDLLLKIMN
jgi:hypothetical protein